MTNDDPPPEPEPLAVQKIGWDTVIDTPASLLVIGGGPAGIEAALYARFLGYDVSVIERKRVGHRLASWERQPMHGSWRQLTSPLGLAALEAQGSPLTQNLESTPSCGEYVEQYLVPVAKTDLLYPSIQINSQVRSISRLGFLPGAAGSDQLRSENEFRILIESKKRGEYSEIADIVFDCSGLDQRLGLASGGGMACGELNLRASESEKTLHWGKLPEESLPELSGKRIVLFGGGLEACTNALSLHEKFGDDPRTKPFWLIPKSKGVSIDQRMMPWQLFYDYGLGGPLNEEVADSEADLAWFRHLHQLSEQITARSQNREGSLVIMDVWGLESIEPTSAGGWIVTAQTQREETLPMECDQFINAASPCADWAFVDRMQLVTQPDEFMTSQPHFYVIGDKCKSSMPQKPTSPVSQMIGTRTQIQQVFELIGGRSGLNLYESVKPQHSG